jgi:hypothetical protein
MGHNHSYKVALLSTIQSDEVMDEVFEAGGILSNDKFPHSLYEESVNAFIKASPLIGLESVQPRWPSISSVVSI